MIPDTWLDEAVKRLKGMVRVTPLTYDPELDLYLKWENHQVTGSFKARGALNKALTLAEWELENGLVTASAGNHGQGVAMAGQQVGVPVVVFASDHVIPCKLEAMQELGAQVVLVEGGYAQAEHAAREYAREQKAAYVSPYNDAQVVAGQGTIGLEILKQLRSRRKPLVCVVPAGGGGLAAGMGEALKRHPGHMNLVASQSEASAFLHTLYTHGDQHQVVESDSLADGLSGEVEDDSITIPLTRSLVDGFVLVSEEDIARAIATAWHRYGEKIEGSAAVALAAVLTNRVAERPALVVLTGGNIQPEVHQEICAKYPSQLLPEVGIE